MKAYSPYSYFKILVVKSMKLSGRFKIAAPYLGALSLTSARAGSPY